MQVNSVDTLPADSAYSALLPSPRQSLLWQQGLVAEYQAPRHRDGGFRRDINPGVRSEYTGGPPPNPWLKPPGFTTLTSLWLMPGSRDWRNENQSHGKLKHMQELTPRHSTAARPSVVSPRLSPRNPLPTALPAALPPLQPDE